MGSEWLNVQPDQAVGNKEDITIVWVDPRIDDSSDNLHTFKLLKQLNSYIHIYTNVELGIEFIKSIVNENVYLIVSGRSCDAILSHVHNCTVLVAVFIFCRKRNLYEELMAQYNKIMSICISQEELIKDVKKTLATSKQEMAQLSVFDYATSLPGNTKSTKDLSNNSALFLWTQLLLDVLAHLPRNDQSKAEMIRYCCDYYKATNSKKELEEINRFKNRYHHSEVISWYTEECFLYKLLNKALKTEDIELLYVFRFFIVDLCQRLNDEKHSSPKTKPIKLYRGQRLPIDELNRLQQSINSLISPNGFFSTTEDYAMARNFATKNEETAEKKPSIFIITAYPELESVVFANIAKYSRYPEEKEYLFGLGSVFRILSVKYSDKSKIWKIYMETTDDGRVETKRYIKQQQDELHTESSLILFGYILWKGLDKTDMAQKYFTMLLSKLDDNNPDKNDIYNQLGGIYRRNGDLERAYTNYKNAYKMRKKQYPKRHIKIINSLTNLGRISRMRKNYDEALGFLRKASQIMEEKDDKDNYEYARNLRNLGGVSIELGRYDEAMNYLIRSYELCCDAFPDDHPDIITNLWKIGTVYERLTQYEEAVKIYQRLFTIQKKVHPVGHSRLYSTLTAIARVYDEGNMIGEGKRFFSEERNDQVKSHGEKSLGVAFTEIAHSILLKRTDSKRARKYCEQGLRLLQELDPSNHKIICECLERIITLAEQQGKYAVAISYASDLLTMQKKHAKKESPEIAQTLERISKLQQESDN